MSKKYSAGFNPEHLKEKIDFDIDIMPQPVKDTVILKGSLRDMGRQYGQQAREQIRRNAAVAVAELVETAGGWDEAFAKLDGYMGIALEKTPQIREFWQSMAEETDLEEEHIALLNCKIPLLVGPPMCSGIAAWGKATVDGRTYTTSNVDNAIDTNFAGINVIAYPEDGNAFISSADVAGQLNGGCVLNDKGLVFMMTGGQCGREEDFQPGYDPVTVMGWMGMHCDSIDAVLEMFYGMDVFAASNYLFASANEPGVAVEYTSAHAKERRAGDFGEEDYLIITNHYLDEEMQVSHFPFPYVDSTDRYDMEETTIRELFGKLSQENMLNLTRQFRKKTEDGIVDNYRVFDVADEELAYNTPNMRAMLYQTAATTMTVPEDKIFRFQYGCADKYVSFIPDSIAEYVEYKLDEDPSAICNFMALRAQQVLWEEGTLISSKADAAECSKETAAEAYDVLSEAKAWLWRGRNLRYMAMTEENEDDKLAIQAEAVTMLARAQGLARYAATLV